MKGWSLSQRVRWLVFSGALLIALGLVAIILMAEVSSQPHFCGSCHIMEPYYESWLTSSHRDVACVDCHIAPGVSEEIRKKWEALSMVTSYVTGTYGTNPWAQVDDAACLQCHQRRLLSGKEVFGDILFDHRPHLTDLRRGKSLRCTSCHSQIVQGEHIAVTTSTCVLCHFKDVEPGKGTGRCTLCHEVPDHVVQVGMVSFQHGDVGRFDMDCLWCHAEVANSSGGEVPQERCFTCHNAPDRLARYAETDLMHRMHVSENKVDCMNCHLEIQHGQTPQLQAAQTSCEKCHQTGHSPQRDLYSGIGGRGVPPMPAPMFAAGVRCEGCHVQIKGHEQETARATEVSCMSCHGPRYRSVLHRWNEGVEQRTRLLRRQLRSTASLVKGPEPQSLVDARHNLHLVDTGRGVHNVRYAFSLLSHSHELINQARVEMGRTPVRTPWPEIPYESPCLQCHQGIESLATRVFGRDFLHSRHAVDQKLECVRCHRPHEEREGGPSLRFGPEGCGNCHHQDLEADCMQCHARIGEKTVVSYLGAFDHSQHIVMVDGCTDCHTLQQDQPARLDRDLCVACHE